MARTRTARLTPLQRAFVEALVGSADAHVRHNATAAYLVACGGRISAASARVCAARLLTRVNIQAAIETAHLQAEAELLTRLVDWKMAAVETQPILLNLARGRMPDGRLMQTRDDAAVAQVVLGALREIMDRGFPKSIYLRIDAKESLARLLGVPRESLPQSLSDDQEGI